MTKISPNDIDWESETAAEQLRDILEKTSKKKSNLDHPTFENLEEEYGDELLKKFIDDDDFDEDIYKLAVEDAKRISDETNYRGSESIDDLADLVKERYPEVIFDNIKKACLNNKITPHTFRHTFATMLLNEGCDLKSVQELLGHSSVAITEIYTEITTKRKKQEHRILYRSTPFQSEQAHYSPAIDRQQSHQ